jgi:two-component system, chemotaxis family, CheB/CheR fusion protein
VVQHLDPTQKALLGQLLQRATAMPVLEATQGMAIMPDMVYVIPPNTELSVVGDKLHLAKPAEPRGMRLPINVLLSSLAQTQQDRAIGVVLSGMGSDGTIGCCSIKAVGGLTAVQEPNSAQFDAMPRGVIAAGCADIVANPESLPERILACIFPLSADPGFGGGTQRAQTGRSPLERIIESLHLRTRHDFALHKPTTLLRRIERRMAIHGLDSLDSYATFLEQNGQEIDLLFKELLIGVTQFFRDEAIWEYLATNVLPDLVARRASAAGLRVWSIGCSTGEEAYSLAMVLTEAVQRLPRAQPQTFQIFASDLSADAIAIARRGQYPLAISGVIDPKRLSRFFTRHEGYYEVSQVIRDKVLFAQHDVALDPPFTRLDLLVCRNVLIYFEQSLQRRLLPLFHYCLRAGGVMVLGASETVGRMTRLFSPVSGRLRIYRREEGSSQGARVLFSQSVKPIHRSTKERSVSTDQPEDPTDKLQVAADRVLLQDYAPAAVLLNSDGDIVYISGHTGKYLEPSAGKANWNIHAMVREELRAPLAGALQQAGTHLEPVRLPALEVASPGGGQRLDITVHRLVEPAALKDTTLVVFRDVDVIPTTGRRRGRKGPADAAHAAELQQYRDEIVRLREEARASREELQAANEELQSTNEELQSTNEELTTSREEMQSINEELQTINAELHSKLDDLALAQSDMKNVLNSTEIAILFLDQDLNVRRFTDRASAIISLRESDVGRPLSDLTTSLESVSLQEDAAETLRTLEFVEKQVPAHDGRWFSVRVMPYRRLDNVVDGVVITFVDITATKELEAALRGNPDS